jgi:transaldolase
MSNAIQDLHELGQSLWYDNIRRGLLSDGTFDRMVSRGEIRGVTSNPSIFNQAIAKSDDYDEQLHALIEEGCQAQEIYESLAFRDIQAAADIFRPLYERTDGGDGYVSLEVNPNLADDTQGTCAEAARLWQQVDRPNLMVKIPATSAGIPAITQSIAAGINVNVTLIFSRDRYQEVMEAYLAGLEERLKAGGRVGEVASVASFFVSRIDTKVDGWLDEIVRQKGPKAEKAAALRGRIAVSNAKLAYQRYREIFKSDRYKILAEAGARKQRPLWASTSTKNPNYRDVKYVEELIGPETVNTVPPRTLEAFGDHGVAALTLETDLEEAEHHFKHLEEVGVDFDRATSELEAEGVRAFSDSFNSLLQTIEKRMAGAG